MLKEGDLIMHETAGVCRVTGEISETGAGPNAVIGTHEYHG